MPALRAETSAHADAGSLLPLLSPDEPLLWMRNGQGIAGIGCVARLEFFGPDRFRQARDAWRAILSRAEVHDPVGIPGSGLVAFGTFAFADSSATSSVLLVPEYVIGRRDGVSWLTRIGPAQDLSTDRSPTPEPFGAQAHCTLHPGNLEPAAYRRAVARAVAHIEDGGVQKVVLARDLVGQLPPRADVRRVIAQLSLAYPECWTYAVDGLIGASPETLVTVQRRALSARVLAGTTSRGADPAADDTASRMLLSSAKDLDEHRFAVTSVVEALEPHCAALTTSDEPFALQLPNLWHLASDVAGVVADDSAVLDLVDALHPTAAVAGTPTKDAVALLAELEGFDRGRYAGAVGWVDGREDGEWAIALRCAQVEDGGMIRAYAGCGIVAGSDPDQELRETDMKFRPIVEALS